MKSDFYCPIPKKKRSCGIKKVRAECGDCDNLRIRSDDIKKVK